MKKLLLILLKTGKAFINILAVLTVIFIFFYLIINFVGIYFYDSSEYSGINTLAIEFLKWFMLLLILMLATTVLKISKINFNNKATTFLWMFNFLVIFFILPITNRGMDNLENIYCLIKKDYDCANQTLEKRINFVYNLKHKDISAKWFKYVDLSCQKTKDYNKCKYLKNKQHLEELLPVYSHLNREENND